MIEFKDEKTKIKFKGHKVQGHFFETIGFVFKIFSTVDKNEKSQDKHFIGYFSEVVLDGASAFWVKWRHETHKCFKVYKRSR